MDINVRQHMSSLNVTFGATMECRITQVGVYRVADFELRTGGVCHNVVVFVTTFVDSDSGGDDCCTCQNAVMENVAEFPCRRIATK